MLSAAVAFKKNQKVPVCQQIITKTEVRTNKNPSGSGGKSVRQLKIEHRNNRDKQMNTIFGEGLVEWAVQNAKDKKKSKGIEITI